jgi:hypothetical protein
MTTDTDQRLRDAVLAAAGDKKRLACERAFAIADEFGLTPAHVGRSELGCF